MHSMPQDHGTTKHGRIQLDHQVGCDQGVTPQQNTYPRALNRPFNHGAPLKGPEACPETPWL